MKKDILGVIFIIAILAILGLFFMFAPEGQKTFGPQEVEVGSVEVVDQPSLDRVTVYVENSEPGFIGVYDSMGGAPGTLIGSSAYFYDGSFEYTVSTTQMQVGSEYFVILHVDDGDEKFDFRTDHAAMVNDEVVRISFEAVASSTEE